MNTPLKDEIVRELKRRDLDASTAACFASIAVDVGRLERELAEARAALEKATT